MIVINNIAIPIEIDRSCIQELDSALRFYVKNRLSPNYEALGNLEPFLEQVYNECKKGWMNEMPETFNLAMKRLEEYTRIPSLETEGK